MWWPLRLGAYHGRMMINCNDIRYRQGFIEVTSIHPRCVNLEVWNIHPDRDIRGRALTDPVIGDEGVIANTEIELGAAQARALVDELRQALGGEANEDVRIQARNPRVGVGVVVLREGRVLLGLRQGSHGAGTWALPGGHLEFGESVEQCAARETLEETGLVIEQVRPGPFTNDVMAAEDKHYVTLFVVADAVTGEPELREPQKCLRWAWFDWTDLPEPLFQPLQTLKRSGYAP